MIRTLLVFLIGLILTMPLGAGLPVWSMSEEYHHAEYAHGHDSVRSMNLFSTENAQVCGYVADSESGIPLSNTYVSMDWRDNMGGWDWNSTYTNASGYFLMNVAAGSIHLYVSKDGYFSEYSDWESISAYEILWKNYSLDPRPNQTSAVKGIVRDKHSEQPLDDAWVNLHWRDSLGHEEWNSTSTNISGWYHMAVAPGEIRLTVYKDGYFETETEWEPIGDNDILWKNLTLEPHPPETSLVRGKVTDETTGLPINNAWVSLYWYDEQDHSLWNWTTTDATGYYQIHVAAGTFDLSFSADGYFYEYRRYFMIGENETMWINQSLYPRPPETAIVQGYVLDAETDMPIPNAEIDLHWQDVFNHNQWNNTVTNDTGYYWFYVAAGHIYLHASKQDYTWNITDWIIIEDFAIYWENFTLEPDNTTPTITDITAPDYVGPNLPGDISAVVTDDHLHQVNMILFDNYTNTFDEKLIIWYLFDFTGENKAYSVSSYSGTYACIEQDTNSAETTCLILSNWTEDDRVYALANFKKNESTAWTQSIVEFNYSQGTVTNLAIPEMSPDQTLHFEYITDSIEPGVSIFRTLAFIADTGQPQEHTQNFTLYNIGNPNNPLLTWIPLNSGVYEGFITALDKAYHTNISFYNLTVDSQPPTTSHELSGTMGEYNWYISTVDMVLTGSDQTSGIAATNYRLDTGPWIPYYGTVLLDDEGEHTVEYYSIDQVNNEEDINGPFDFRIDATPPDITLTVEKQFLSTWLFTATVEDETSGIEKVEFYLDGELLGTVTTAPYEWEWKAQRGDHTVQAIAYDIAGNTAASEEKENISQSNTLCTFSSVFFSEKKAITVHAT